MNVAQAEAEKYAAIWQVPDYFRHSPGAGLVDMFCRIAAPSPHASVMDIGAGSGAASRILADRGFRVSAFDLTDVGWDRDLPIRLTLGTAWQDIPGRHDFIYCVDVMEHLPIEFVGLAVARMLECAPTAFFGVSFEPDEFGAYVGQTLHLTVKPFAWWRDMLREIGVLEEARDLIGSGVFLLRRPA